MQRVLFAFRVRGCCSCLRSVFAFLVRAIRQIRLRFAFAFRVCFSCLRFAIVFAFRVGVSCLSLVFKETDKERCRGE